VGPDGRRITFSVLPQNADLWRLGLDPRSGAAHGAPEALVATSREDSRGAWSPDGAGLAFDSDRGGDMNLWLQASHGGAPRQLTRGAGGDYQPNWSPDGAGLAFFSARTGNADIWSVRVADAGLTQLTDDPALDITPFYSPDGRRIAFMSDRDGRLEVWEMRADGGGQRRLTTVGVAGHFLRWLSDEALVFRSDVGTQRRIYRLELATGALIELPKIESGGHMSFSPDRSLVLDVAGHKLLRVFPLDGSPPRPVFEFADPAVRIDYPVWSPDGRWVVFDRVAPQGGDIWLLEIG
ncbi:MAG: TolB family protein, partial [Thermoanaerobaculia bacterium]